MSKDDIIAGGRRTPPLRAPYNFVRLNAKVLPTPLANGPSHAEPVADHLSGEIEVAWQAETPFLVGGSDNDAPCRYGENGRFVIPGASLRGLTRATLEIAAYARLAFVDDQLFGLRDFDSVTWQGVIKNGYDRFNVNNIKAGWLKKIEENGKARIILSVVGDFALVAISDICERLKDVHGPDFAEWQETPLGDRKALLTKAGLAVRLTWVERTDIPRQHFEKRIYRPAKPNEPTNTIGYLVVAGAANRPGEAGSNKKYETVFFGGFEDGKHREISDCAWERFKKIQIEDGRRHGDVASTNWSYLRKKFDAGEAIPVFLVGDPGSPDLALSLTRLMRVPYRRGVHEVAERTQPDMKAMAKLDFVQALFGHTPEKGVEPDPAKPLTLPWKGRVFFRHAELTGDEPEPGPAVPMVTMQPKPSFFPYYLRPAEGANAIHPVDWSNDAARLAGRKRYPSRNGAAVPGGVVRAVNADRGAEQESQPQFLPASRQNPLCFTSRIRLHNVSPIELGGLLFALTFGQLGKDPDRGYRHMLGRAKGYGYGQIRSWIAGSRLVRADGKAAPSLAECLESFEQWVTSLVGEPGQTFEALPEISGLLALAHAATGEAVRDHLRFPSIPRQSSTDAEAILKAYQQIKKTTSTASNRTFAQDGQNHQGRGRSEASDQAGEDAFWFLPRY